MNTPSIGAAGTPGIITQGVVPWCAYPALVVGQLSSQPVVQIAPPSYSSLLRTTEQTFQGNMAAQSTTTSADYL